jgi:hypothetical protein
MLSLELRSNMNNPSVSNTYMCLISAKGDIFKICQIIFISFCYWDSVSLGNLGLSWNLLCSPCWPLTHHFPTSDFKCWNYRYALSCLIQIIFNIPSLVSWLSSNYYVWYIFTFIHSHTFFLHPHVVQLKSAGIDGYYMLISLS